MAEIARDSRSTASRTARQRVPRAIARSASRVAQIVPLIPGSDANIAAMARRRYALLLLVALMPVIGASGVKLAPLMVAAFLFVLHATLSFTGFGRERFVPRDVLSALLLIGCFTLSAMFVVTSLAVLVAPPVTSDGHHVMPIGQAFVGIVGGGIAGGALSFVALRPRWRDRDLERLVLHVVGALFVVVAVVRWAQE
jgi:uncharacterized membrane protein YeaQ/YmgE (transglycosylase-associated protein family)